jgi:uncharacterized membrane protein YvlD (DUF360 family)
MDAKHASGGSPDLVHQVLRGLLVLIVDAAALLLLAAVLERFTLEGPGAALATAALVGLLNALVWPTLSRLALPLSVLTLGGFSILLNAIVVAFAIDVVPGAEISGIPEAIVLTMLLTLITALLSSLLAIDDDESWYRNVVASEARRRQGIERTDVPGVLFLEIDGLAHDVLRRAIRGGSAPTIGRWLAEGSHRLHGWETDLSSQTGACQAGILHGDNDDMPAFRWWEKDRDSPIVTNHPRDAAELERRHSDGRGLLYADGASRANILSGDAPSSMLTMSTVLTRRRPIGRDYAAYFARPYAAFKTLNAVIAEYARERRAQAHQRRRDVRPRIRRDRRYALVRAWATVIQLDLQVAAVVGDMLAGRPVVYTTFLAYDEVAHHSGIERPDTLAVLEKVDRQLARVEAATADAPRPYRLVVLSDHGQSQGATFLQRYGMTLEDLVRGASRADSSWSSAGGSDEAGAYLGAGVTELSREPTPVNRAMASAGERIAEPGTVDRDGAEGPGEVPDLAVMASGCLGLISFPREPGRLTRERIEELHPRLIETLRGHPGIGFVLVRDEELGGVVLGAGGSRVLATGAVEGNDPLEPFGPGAARHVIRTDGFPHCPDLLVNSAYWEDMEEVAAFEELVGSHGGIGGPQSRPFVCAPADLPWPDEPVVGAESVHRILRGWLAGLGQSAYADGSGEADEQGGGDREPDADRRQRAAEAEA